MRTIYLKREGLHGQKYFLPLPKKYHNVVFLTPSGYLLIVCVFKRIYIDVECIGVVFNG